MTYMRGKKLATVIYAIALAVDFYILPLLIRDTGSGMFIMLLALPLILAVCSMIYGWTAGLVIPAPIITVLMFTPTVFIFYNSTAWVYLPIYAVISAAAAAIGKILGKISSDEKKD